MTYICHQISHEAPPFQRFNHAIASDYNVCERNKNPGPSNCMHLFDSICLSALHIATKTVAIWFVLWEVAFIKFTGDGIW